LLKKADWNHIGHDNRVFALKFVDEFTLISGGWDSVIHIWDLRQGKSVKHFYGSHISGESLDFQDGMILAGCYAAKNQVQIWNLKKGTKEETIDWTNNIDQAAYVYAAGFSHHDIGVIGAASTGAVTSVKLWKDLENKGEHVLLNEVKGAN
jgi:COMPASS component SWD3